MVRRVTDSMLLRNALSDVSRQRVRLADVQEKSSSGLEVNRPSDDPVRASAAILLRAGLDATAQFERNVSSAQGRVSILEASLGDGIDALIEARTVALEGANETKDQESMLLLADEVAALHSDILSAANGSTGGSYVFGGFASDAPPFVASGPFVEGAPSPTVSFTGDSNQIQIQIDEGITVDTTLDGRRVFLGDGDGDGLVDAGSEHVFAVLGDLRDALVSGDSDAVAAILPRIDSALDGLNAERGRVGFTDQKLSDWDVRLADRTLSLTTRLSDAQDVDAAEVFSDLVNQENALDASLQAAARVLQHSLLDFLS